jgi:hypothetical protein
MPKPMGVNLFNDQNNQKPVVKKKISLFDDVDNNETNNVNVNINLDTNKQTNQVKAPLSLFEGIDTKPQEIKEEQKPNPNPIINNLDLQNQKKAEEKKKLPAFFFEDEEKDAIKTAVQPNLQPKQQIIQPLPQQQPPQKNNLFSNIEPEKQVKKKASLFDALETNSRQTIANTNINTRPELNKKEENNPRISKPEEDKKRISVLEEPTGIKTGGNKMASRFEQMLEDQKKEERKSVHAAQPPKPKKLDFASKISSLQNVLGGRMAMGGNVFTMPTGGIKSLANVGADIVHDSGNENIDAENIKTEVKEISS